MLQFLTGWLACDPGRLGPSLEDFVGHPACGIAQLRQDLERFVFCSAAATASPCSAHDRGFPRARPGLAAERPPCHRS
jgi:hypothetical protein